MDPKSPLGVLKKGCTLPWEPQMGEGSGIQLGPLLQRRAAPAGAFRASGTERMVTLLSPSQQELVALQATLSLCPGLSPN